MKKMTTKYYTETKLGQIVEIDEYHLSMEADINNRIGLTDDRKIVFLKWTTTFLHSSSPDKAYVYNSELQLKIWFPEIEQIWAEE